jgi:hypothetical protein
MPGYCNSFWRSQDQLPNSGVSDPPYMFFFSAETLDTKKYEFILENLFDRGL